MRLHREFAILCESILNENSLALRNETIRSAPLGTRLIQQLHQNRWLAHDTEFLPFDNKSWGSLKATTKRWTNDLRQLILIFGKIGSAAILMEKGDYKVILTRPRYQSDVNEKKNYVVEEFTSNNIRKVLTILTQKIGKLHKEMLMANTGSITQLRAQYSQTVQNKEQETDEKVTGLLLKLKPLWKKLLTAAIASLREYAREAVKNDSYDLAKMYINRAEYLRNMLDNLDDEDSVLYDFTSVYSSNVFSKALRNAMLHASYYHYPEMIPDDMEQNIPFKNPVFVKLLQDIYSGDIKKLSTVLYYFKRGLLIQ